MNQIPHRSGKPLHLGHERQDSAASTPHPERRRITQQNLMREGRALSVATLIAIGALSLGAVGGLAYLSDGHDRPAPAHVSVASNAAQRGPERLPAARETKPATAAVAPAHADTKPNAAQAPVVAPSARPPLEEPIKTASISPAVPLPVMSVPPRSFALAEPVAKAPELDARPIDPKPVTPTPQHRPTLSGAEAEGYLAKAEAALRSGDLSVARSFFIRLVQADDPRGAVGMARTYDDAELKKLPVFGLKPDRAEAERWRLRAREMTTAVAKR
jgi:hypothetical protein